MATSRRYVITIEHPDGGGPIVISVPCGAPWPSSRVEEVRPDDTPEPPALLSECERDIVQLLRGTDIRLTTGQILAELARANKIHGESTVKRALAHLAATGILNNSRRSPRGYRLENRR